MESIKAKSDDRYAKCKEKAVITPNGLFSEMPKTRFYVILLFKKISRPRWKTLKEG
jgi:hypothetical protein